jgi:hypothetical protein
MHVKSLFERRELWSIGIYKVESTRDIMSLDTRKPLYLIGEKGLRKSRDYQSLVADPFLFSFAGKLYLFYEVKTDHGHGEIWAQTLSEKGQWIELGKVLSEDFHLSYPQVFQDNGRIYMIPEAAQSGRVLLYEAVDFPLTWKVSATLVDEPLRDPTIFSDDDAGFLLLATTADYQLKLYHASVLNGPFSYTGMVISKDPAVSRCAGSIVEIDGEYLRPAQDCSKFYGERVQLLRITEASRLCYHESLVVPDLFTIKPTWMSRGSHHLSSAEHNGAVYVAVDGRRKDRYINTLLLVVLKVVAFS